MSNRIEVSASQFRSLCTILGYRKRKVIVVATTSVVLSNLNWDGGSRSTYHTMEIESGKVISHDHFSRPHPMDNEREGAKVAIAAGQCVVETGVFCGKDMTMRIYVHPDDMPKTVAA